MGMRSTYPLTGSALDSALARWTQAGFVKTIQRGTIIIASGNVSNTGTITSVDVNNARSKYLGNNDAGADSQPSLLARVALTNGTTVTAFVNTAPTNNLTVAFEIVEYFPGVIKSVQRGSITITGGTGTNTATITTVNTLKSELTYLGTTIGSTGADVAWLALTNATTVTATNKAGSSTSIVGYEVVEWF